MFKLDISKYVIMAVIVVTMVRVWQVMVKKHDCEMTWMFERANFTRILLPSDVQELYPAYGLYFYGEGLYAQVSELEPCYHWITAKFSDKSHCKVSQFCLYPAIEAAISKFVQLDQLL